MPFHCKKALDILYSKIKEIKPDIIVCLGDAIDNFSVSRFPKNPNIITPGDELEQAYEAYSQMWTYIKKIAPKATLYTLEGNHQFPRVEKTVLVKAPELYTLVKKGWNSFFKVPGVTVIPEKEDLIIDNIIYEHGHKSKPLEHLLEARKSIVFAHIHRAWLLYHKLRNDLLFEMACGYLADPNHEALNYTRKKYKPWVHSFGVIKNGTPSLVCIDK